MILALDLGLRRVGVAGSRSGLLAEPLETVTLKRGQLSEETGIAELCQALWRLADGETIELLVIGLPMAADGQPSPFGRELEAFGQQVAAELKSPAVFEDETLSTASGGSDEQAAAIILEQYLASQPERSRL